MDTSMIRIVCAVLAVLFLGIIVLRRKKRTRSSSCNRAKGVTGHGADGTALTEPAGWFGISSCADFSYEVRRRASPPRRTSGIAFGRRFAGTPLKGAAGGCGELSANVIADEMQDCGVHIC